MVTSDTIDKLVLKHAARVIILSLFALYFCFAFRSFMHIYLDFLIISMVQMILLFVVDKVHPITIAKRAVFRGAYYLSRIRVVKALAVTLFVINLIYGFVDENTPMIKFSFIIINFAYYIYIDIIIKRRELMQLVENKDE